MYYLDLRHINNKEVLIMEIKKIMINKNRGWRGLAEVQCRNAEDNNELKMIFSFSQPVWQDLLRGVIVLQNTEKYFIVHFDNVESLPRPEQQRSVLIKNFVGNVTNVVEVPKTNWVGITRGTSYFDYIQHFNKNRNNHTTSDWNNIGIRVIPMI